jgi:uncharacterized protein (TIGR00299 family) protein
MLHSSLHPFHALNGTEKPSHTYVNRKGERLRTAYFDCFSGASGDMLLGSLLDAGLAIEDLQADLKLIHMGGYRLETQRVTRKGLTGTQLRVLLENDERPARHLSTIENLIGESTLPEKVKARCLAVFRRIAQAEANVHGTTVEQVHFHEIGAVDTLVDVVGFVCALERLRIEAAYSSPLTLGSGTIHTEHGLLPVPAPATLALLAQVGAPTVPSSARTELVTPTGAALLTECASFRRPAMTIASVGYGFGTRELEWPNALRVWMGNTHAPHSHTGSDQVVQLSSNLDDATAETLGYAMDILLAAGALDVWFTPIHMKKNRPATQLNVLARPEEADHLAELVLRETPTLGVRHQCLSRHRSSRQIVQVVTPWGPVRVKLKTLQGTIVAASPEYDDCAQLAAKTGLPLGEVMLAARKAAQTQNLDSPDSVLDA